jgi:hypothetical protein
MYIVKSCFSHASLIQACKPTAAVERGERGEGEGKARGMCAASGQIQSVEFFPRDTTRAQMRLFVNLRAH